VDTGANPHPHLPDTPLHGPVPSPGSIPTPSRRVRVAAVAAGIVLVGWFGYQALWGASDLPGGYCEAVSGLTGTLQGAADGSVTGDELASQLRLASSDLSTAGPIDPARAGTSAIEDIERLKHSVAVATNVAATGADTSEALDAVRTDLARVPSC
jgi:hypothetical protein